MKCFKHEFHSGGSYYGVIGTIVFAIDKGEAIELLKLYYKENYYDDLLIRLLVDLEYDFAFDEIPIAPGAHLIAKHFE